MFNVPIPGGITGHAVGSALVAIILGPWAAVVTTSVALLIQCLLFGDGGITTFGANCFNMAVVIPFVGFYTYKFIAGKTKLTSRRRIIGAGVGAWLGLTFAAACAGFEMGIQPIINVSSTGVPLDMPVPSQRNCAGNGIGTRVLLQHYRSHCYGSGVYLHCTERSKHHMELQSDRISITAKGSRRGSLTRGKGHGKSF